MLDSTIVPEMTVVITFCETGSQTLRDNGPVLNLKYNPRHPD